MVWCVLQTGDAASPPEMTDCTMCPVKQERHNNDVCTTLEKKEENINAKNVTPNTLQYNILYFKMEI